MRVSHPLPRILVPLMVAAALGIAPTYPRISHAAAGTVMVLGSFEATVHQGPDVGLSLTGTLTLRSDSHGTLMGQLVPQHGHAVPVSGQLNGVAINLVFYTGHGQHIFGTGTFGQEPGAAAVFVGGPLVGPKAADAGAWAGFANYCDDHPDAEGCNIRPKSL